MAAWIVEHGNLRLRSPPPVNLHSRIEILVKLGSPASLQPLGRPRARAEPPVQPAAPVLHGRALATGGSSRLRPASLSGGEVPRLVLVFQPSAPLCMGFIWHFSTSSPTP